VNEQEDMSADESAERNRKDSESSFANKKGNSIEFILEDKDKSAYAIIQNSSFKASVVETDLKKNDTLNEVSVIINLESDYRSKKERSEDSEKDDDFPEMAFKKTVKKLDSSQLSSSSGRMISNTGRMIRDSFVNKNFSSFNSLTSQKSKDNKDDKQGYLGILEEQKNAINLFNLSFFQSLKN
jgi:hypothetical protein